jgi:hypothetical protein
MPTPAPAFADRTRSVSSLIALWLAIHAGDPAPEAIRVDETATLLAGALDLYLASAIEGSVREDQIIAGRLGSYGIEPVRRPEPENARIFEFCQRIQVIDIKTLKPTGTYITVCTPVRLV